MAEANPDRRREQGSTAMKRRGMLAAAWAAVAAIVARRTTEPVGAATTDTNFVATGTATNFDAKGSAGIGLNTSTGSFSIGVAASGSAIGVIGTGGTYGVSANGSTYGVAAFGNVGVIGSSSTSHGVVGSTNAPGAAGIIGSAQGAAGVWGGVFFGPIAVVGGAKSAAVANGDGTHSLLYCMESPESWFEDFGEATLDCGRAEVAVDPAFAALVDLTHYHVFLTAHDRHHLAVTARTPTQFRVEAVDIAHGDANPATALAGTFSWRLVAKRKDVAAPRLARVRLPAEPVRIEAAMPPMSGTRPPQRV
jgi:hypothetical protein